MSRQQSRRHVGARHRWVRGPTAGSSTEASENRPLSRVGYVHAEHLPDPFGRQRNRGGSAGQFAGDHAAAFKQASSQFEHKRHGPAAGPVDHRRIGATLEPVGRRTREHQATGSCPHG